MIPSCDMLMLTLQAYFLSMALEELGKRAAANNMTGGRTAHSRFKIPINLTTNSMCNIKKQSGLAKLLCQAKLIIWDEASMAKRQAVEAVLQVVRRGTRAQIVDSSLRMSPLWSIIKRMRLTINMRARTDPWFSSFLLRVGDGVEEVIDEYYVRIPDDMTIPYTNDAASKNALINELFPSFATNASLSSDIVSRAILSTKNEHVDNINNELINRFPGEEKVYYSFDEAEDDTHNFYPLEFSNSLNVTGLPPYCLRLKVSHDFDLPNINADVRPYAFGCREVHEECSIVVLEEDILARPNVRSSVSYFTCHPPPKLSRQGLAANNMTREENCSRKIATTQPGADLQDPINLTTNSMCNIKKQSSLAKLLCQAKLIIWDEALMAKRQAVKAVDRTMQDITGVKLPFGGKIMVLGGDFRQVLPVVRHGTRAQIIDLSLRMSPLWSIIKRMRLTINMRERTDPWFSSFLLRVGDGVEEVIDEYYVRIPDDMTISYTNDAALKNALINEIFPSFASNASLSSDIVSRAILSTKNKHVDSINNEF
ncbi:ATP-dependent DNA helicase PIF1-like protein [Tanacetum coccineum]